LHVIEQSLGRDRPAKKLAQELGSFKLSAGCQQML
jgi:hypothetical protein